MLVVGPKSVDQGLQLGIASELLKLFFSLKKSCCSPAQGHFCVLVICHPTTNATEPPSFIPISQMALGDDVRHDDVLCRRRRDIDPGTDVARTHVKSLQPRLQQRFPKMKQGQRNPGRIVNIESAPTLISQSGARLRVKNMGLHLSAGHVCIT